MMESKFEAVETQGVEKPLSAFDSSKFDNLNREERRKLTKLVKYSEAKGFTVDPKFSGACVALGLDPKTTMVIIARRMAEGQEVTERVVAKAAQEYLYKQSIKGSKLEDSNWEMVDEFYPMANAMFDAHKSLEKPLTDLRPFVEDTDTLDALVRTLESDTNQLRQELGAIEKMHIDEETGTRYSGPIGLDNIVPMMEIVSAQQALMERYTATIEPTMLQVEEQLQLAQQKEAAQNGTEVSEPVVADKAAEPYSE